MVLFTGLTTGLGLGIFDFGFSVIFKDLAAELGLTRAITSLANGIGRMEAGLVCPIAGWLSDRFGPKWIIFAGICITALSIIAMNFITSTTVFLLVWGVLMGIGINLACTIAADKVIVDWFVSKRGLAQGIKFGIVGIVCGVVPPVVTLLVTNVGWRTACVVLGVFMLLCTPLVLTLIKQKRPEYYGLMPDGASIASGSDPDTLIDKGREYASHLHETEFTFKKVLTTRAFWIVTASYLVFNLVYGGVTLHVIPFLTDMGIDKIAAGGMMSLMSFISIPARFLSGVFADRIGKEYLKFLLAGAFALIAAGIGTFLIAPHLASVYVLLILYGLGYGSITPLIIFILGRYFGRKAFGSIFGVCMIIQAPASLLAPSYSGWVYDTTGSYAGAFMIFVACSALIALALCFARAPESSG